MIATDLPWELARRLPWHVLSSPARQWAVMPSFVVGEYLFIACAAAAWVHAWRQGPERRKHLLVWIGALLAGTANDMIFMALPLVNNFWQAQATIMLTPRLPLYIPCVYVCFMYFPTVSVWRTNAPPLARAALTGLAAIVFYAPYDIVGARFLWWTWHDSDPRIANRILGAPIGSTMWVIAFTAAFAWLLGRVVDKDPRVSTATFAKGIALVCGLSTVLMIVVMTPLQVLDGGMPGVRGLAVLVAVFAGIAWRGLRRARLLAPRAPRASRLRSAAARRGGLVLRDARRDRRDVRSGRPREHEPPPDLWPLRSRRDRHHRGTPLRVRLRRRTSTRTSRSTAPPPPPTARSGTRSAVGPTTTSRDGCSPSARSVPPGRSSTRTYWARAAARRAATGRRGEPQRRRGRRGFEGGLNHGNDAPLPRRPVGASPHVPVLAL